MSVELTSVILFVGLLALLALGIPITIALGGLVTVLTYLLNGPEALYTVASTTYQQITSNTLLTIPLFLVMGNFLVHSGISERMFHGLGHWLSNVRGGLAIVAVLVCVALAMCGGFGPGILTMGLVATPAMLKRGYSTNIALGTVIAGGVLGEIIPPSIIMIIFAFIARVSTGKLFAGGMIPGLILASFFIFYVVLVGFIRPEQVPKLKEEVTWPMRWRALYDIFLPGSLVLLVLGSIYFGIATPTEAAAVGACGAMLICIVYRRLSWSVLWDSCQDTLKITGMALWILIPATLFGVFYSSVGAQDMVMDLVSNLAVSRWVILAVMMVILLIFGCFMDDFAICTICAPIMLPIAVHLGFDPIWFGIVFVLNMQVAYLSPPFGWALIMMRGVAPVEVTTAQIWRSVPPFVIMQLLVLALCLVFPELITWLPNRTM